MEKGWFQAVRCCSKEGGEEMSQKTGPRLIVHQDTAAGITNDGVAISTQGSNWQFDTSATSWKMACEDTIDLHGYVPDDLTFLVSDIAIQDAIPPTWSDFAAVAANRNELFVSHRLFVTTSPVAQRNANNIFSPIIPGFLVINDDGEQEIAGLTPSEVIYGHVATYQSVNTIATSLYALTQTNFAQFGLGKPIVSDRLYVYQIWEISSVDDIIGGSRTLLGSISVSPINIVLIGESKEEPDYMYMHRMAQQYQLQQSYDED